MMKRTRTRSNHIMPDTIYVAILEDHPMITKGYEAALSNLPHIKVVGAANCGEDLLPLLEQHHVDLLLLDVEVPVSKVNRSPFPVLAVIPKIIQSYPSLYVLAASMHNERSLIQAIMEQGASGYILKDDLKGMSELEAIITSIVNGGEIYISDEAHYELNMQHGKKKDKPLLTPGQHAAISLCGSYPNKSIAELAKMLNLVESTTRNTLANCYARLGVRNRAAAVERARQLGLITPPTSPPSISDLQQPEETNKETVLR